MSAFRATHTIVAGGAQGHATADGPPTPVTGGLAVMLVETAGAWSKVRFDNGWECWVDPAALVPVRGGAASAASAGSTAGGSGRSSGGVLLVVGIVVVLALVAGGALVLSRRGSDPATTAAGGAGGGRGGKTSAGGDAPVPAALLEWKAGDDRARVEDQLGPPAAFYRNFGAGGVEGQPVIDTYVYPASEMRFHFGNGVYLRSEDFPAATAPDGDGLPDGVVADDFKAGMSPEDVAAHLGDEQGRIEIGDGDTGWTQVTYASGQALFGGGGLLFVYAGPVGEAPDVRDGEKDAATQATTTVPANFAPTARSSGATRSPRAYDTPPAAGIAGAAAAGGLLSWIWSLLGHAKDVSDKSELLDTTRMHAELLAAKQVLDTELTKAREQLSAGGLSDLEKHRVEQYIATAESLSRQVADADAAMPKSKLAFDQFLPWYSPSSADTTDFKALYDQLVQSLGGVDRLDERTKAFLARAQVDWESLGADQRRTVLIGLFVAKIRKTCGGAPADGTFEDWQDCINRQLNELRKTDFPPATTLECWDALKGARDRYQKPSRLRGVPTSRTQAKIEEKARSCPAPGLYAQDPVPDYGVFTADIDITVGTQAGIENIPTCSWVGWGLDCQTLIGEAVPVTMRLGPFATEAEATKAMCDAIIKGSERTVPNVAGGRRADTSFGKGMSIDNAPSCP